MTDDKREQTERTPGDPPEQVDPLLKQQEQKGYGDDEGEREEALERE